MWGLVGVAKGVAILEDGGNTAGSRTEHGWIGEAEVGI